MNIDKILEKNLLPDSVIRFGIRRLLKQRLLKEQKSTLEEEKEALIKLVEYLKQSPIAVNTLDANEQHYELPTRFFQTVLGEHVKYSCGYWEKEDVTLDESEKAMLQLTCERAGIQNGESILELGCGWGSLTLFMAERFPKSDITAVSNSKTQKEYVDGEAQKRGLTNITVITSDINDFSTEKEFDRIVSVEMFEHMRNYKALLEKVRDFLKPGGELFVHIFSHHKYAYLFEVKDNTDWMAKYFFTGGIMPSDNLLLYFATDFETKNHWIVNGEHYEKTANAWVKKMDANKDEILKMLAETYGEENKIKWWVYWRVFFMSCAELWGYKGGKEWFVSHYLFKKR